MSRFHHPEFHSRRCAARSGYTGTLLSLPFTGAYMRPWLSGHAPQGVVSQDARWAMRSIKNDDTNNE